MSEDPPALGPSAQELWQWAQTVNAFVMLAQRFRSARERPERLAERDDEHAALQHEARQHPPLRLMRDGEQQEWLQRVPAALAAQQLDEPVSVWSAQLVDEHGVPTGDWGLEAHTWDEDGAVTATLFAVCRDAEDALALTRHLREHGTPERLAGLQELAEQAQGRFVQSIEPDATAGSPGNETVVADRARVRMAPALSEQAWADALRRALPPRTADAVVAMDPAHRHHRAWRELHALANAEVLRVGADPDKLATVVRSVPRWREDVKNAPALAHWAITTARAMPNYDRMVTNPPGRLATADESAPTATASTGGRRLVDVSSPREALEWANELEATNAQHQIEAKLGFGRWGGEVDSVLATKFPGLAAATKGAATRSADEEPTIALVTGEVAVVEDERAQRPSSDRPAVASMPETDMSTLRGIAADVASWDPDRPVNRRSAYMMLGRTDPAIDRMIAEKFGDDPRIIERLQELYPDGLPEADAASWRNRADADEAVAAADRSEPDDPRTLRREDVDGQVTAQAPASAAAQQRGIANTVAGTQSPVVRRLLERTAPTAAGPIRRA